MDTDFHPAVINSKPAGALLARGQNKNSISVVKNKQSFTASFHYIGASK